MIEGWICIHRKVKDHWLWKDPIKLKWWLDILLTVNHSDKKVALGNELILCKRGQSLQSLQTWADQWQTSKSMVRRFFDLLQSDEMIVTESVKKSTRLTVCKYDSYQETRNANETQVKRKRNTSETQTAPNNNDNNDNNEDKDIYIDFEGLTEREIEYWKNFNKWFQEQPFPNIRKFKSQLKPVEFIKLQTTYGGKSLADILAEIENHGKKYESVYLTANNWLKRNQEQAA